jgi:hypothetical protein
LTKKQEKLKEELKIKVITQLHAISNCIELELFALEHLEKLSNTFKDWLTSPIKLRLQK